MRQITRNRRTLATRNTLPSTAICSSQAHITQPCNTTSAKMSEIVTCKTDSRAYLISFADPHSYEGLALGGRNANKAYDAMGVKGISNLNSTLPRRVGVINCLAVRGETSVYISQNRFLQHVQTFTKPTRTNGRKPRRPS